MCLTVEIDRQQFPNVMKLVNDLDEASYISNKNYVSLGECYQFEFDCSYVEHISAKLAEMIKTDYLTKCAERLVDAEYFDIDTADKKAIINTALCCADTDSLISMLCDFLEENKHIHLGGFVLFRMKEFLNEFAEEIDFAVDEYMQKKRYKDFVSFLRFFLDIQDSVIDRINLVLCDGDNYQLLDEAGIPVDKSLLDSSYCEIAALDADNGYVMLNDLISLAPRHIIIHCKDRAESVEKVNIIREIFSGRVEICHNCCICTESSR